MSRASYLRAATSLAALTTALTAAVPALAEPVRLLISVGSQKGLAAERPLRFATSDAARVRETFVGYGGVRPRDAEVLREPSRADLFAAIARARDEAARHREGEVTVVFYFSGHGDRDAIHLGNDRVLLTDVQAELATVRAALRIVVTDACRTNRDKGFNAEEPFAISLAATPQATGSVWLHASSEGESAQESDELEGAIFTHSWLNGLRGAADANSDSQVTLEESFAFAHAQTMIRSSKSSGVLQKPEAAIALHELAPVVLTETRPKLSGLSLPSGRDVHYLVYTAGSKSVLAELWAAPARPTTFRVPQGRYTVLRRESGLGSAAQIDVADNEVRILAPNDFTPVSLDAVARKGGESPHENEISLAYELGTSARFGTSQGARLDYGLGLTRFVALTAGGAVETSAPETAVNDERIYGARGRVGAELRLPWSSFVTLHAGAGGHAGVLFQTLSRRDASALERDGFATKRSERAFVAGPEVSIGVRAATAGSGKRAVFGDITLGGRGSFLQEENGLRGLFSASVMTGVGARF